MGGLLCIGETERHGPPDRTNVVDTRYGVPDPVTGLNLATCVWQSRAHAIAANSRPHHIRAMRLAASSYEVYSLERHVLHKEKGERGVTIEEFIGGEVGW